MKLTKETLTRLNAPIRKALGEYQIMHGDSLRFKDFAEFSLTTDKPNSARTVVPVELAGKKEGEMYVIVFAPCDGTGDEKTYKVGELTIPQRLIYTEKPQRVIPRAKTGVICEGFFPLFSLDERRDYMFATSLEELTTGQDSKEVVHAWQLGLNEFAYKDVIEQGLKIKPRVHFTVGTLRGERFGDPHSVHYGIDTKTLQVAGFLAIADKDNPLLTRTKRWEYPK